MTKGELMDAWDGMPENTELEIHIESDDGSEAADFALEEIGPVSGATNPPFFTFKVGDLIATCK